jgi:hypothetical protein
LARQRGFRVVGEYTDVISGARSKRPGLDRLLSDARRGNVDIVLVVAFDRLAVRTGHAEIGGGLAKLEVTKVFALMNGRCAWAPAIERKQH